MPLEEVFQTLRCDSNGLTTKSAEERLAIFGHNKLEEKQVLAFNFSSCSSSFAFSLFSRERCFVVANGEASLSP